MNERIILGTVQFGTLYGINNLTGQPSEPEVHNILKSAYDLGVRCLDTAEGYGTSQKIIGNFNRSHPDCSFQISTKFTVSNDRLESQLTKSLSDLCAGSVYCYFFHRFEDFSSLGSRDDLAIQLLAIKNAGQINKIGVSVYTNDQFKAAIASDLIDVIQIPFNLLDNWSQRGEWILRAKTKKKEIHARSIFLQGLLCRDPNSLPAYFSELKPDLEKISKLSNEIGIKVHELALQYALSFSEIDYILIGVETKEQLLQNLDITSQKIMPDLKQKISSLNVQATDLLDPRNWKFD